MAPDLINLLLLAFVGSIAGLIGGAVFLVKKDWAKSLCLYAVPFAAGVLISVSLLHLLPEAVHEIGQRAFPLALFALLGSFLFEEYFAHLHHHDHHHRSKLKASIPLVLFGDTIHNFIDGVAIAAAYLANPVFGVIVAFASFLHETPHEIGDFGILISAGWSRRKAFVANLLSALFTFPGALLVYYAMGDTGEKVGALLAISAGIFLYLGASDFLPEVGEEEKGISTGRKIVVLLLGVGIMFALTFISPEP